MQTSIYIVGSEPLKDWEKRNDTPTGISLTGVVSANEFERLAAEFDYSKYRHISFEGLELLDYVYENGFSCSLEDYLSHRTCDYGDRLSVLLKLYLNTKTCKIFVVADDCIFTSDFKTLVHIPETKYVVIPRFVDHIGIAVCCGYEDMQELSLNEGLKSIGKWAFVSAGIARLDMPDTVVSLGEDAFLMADLESVRLSNALEAIPDGCFNLCMIEEFSVPSSVKTIGNGALKGLLWINEIDIPEGVERIGYNAFEGMFRVSLPSTLIEIAPDFYYEECIDDPNDVPYITVHSGNKTFVSNNGSLYFRESGKLALDSEYHGKLTMYDTNMTERANVVYNEVSASFQQGDGSVELDMLDNLHDILKFVDDDFIGQFSFAVNNELVEIEDDEGSTPMYDNPSVTFRMLHNKRIYFTVDCGGVRCVNPDHPVFGEEGSKYPACFIPNDVVGFRFEVNENNECVALEFIEYFTKNFIRNKEWI